MNRISLKEKTHDNKSWVFFRTECHLHMSFYVKVNKKSIQIIKKTYSFTICLNTNSYYRLLVDYMHFTMPPSTFKATPVI